LNVNLAIYDINRRLLQQPVQEYVKAGLLTIIFYAKDRCSGVYLLKMTVGDKISQRKLMLVK